MNQPARVMSCSEFAAFQRSQGIHVQRVDGVFWRQVRPFFYRPLLPFEELLPSSTRAPAASWIGCYQFAVPSGHRANSHLNLLMFDDVPTYSLDSLDVNRRRQVRLAAKRLTIREMPDPAELKVKAHPVYLSFYERTRYGFKTDRRDQAVFARWVDDLFLHPGNIVLGACVGSELCGVSVSQIVGDTWLYSTFFCDDRGLKLCAADLMLHTVRENAATNPEVRQIFAGMYKGGNGPDSAMLLRGCKLIRKPAMLRGNPAASLFLRLFLPGQSAKLLGKFKEPGNEVSSSREAVAG